jgi:hypothetical protein
MEELLIKNHQNILIKLLLINLIIFIVLLLDNK